MLQNLYEQHKLVTYPRTDSKYLTKDMENTMYDRLLAVKDAYKEEVQPVLSRKGKILAKRVINDAKVTDHHAIIPTDERPALSDLSADERKIYDLIVKRFLALFYPVYEYETVQFKLQAGGKTMTGRTMAVKNAGFTAVLHHEQERENTTLLSIKEGKNLSWNKSGSASI